MIIKFLSLRTDVRSGSWQLWLRWHQSRKFVTQLVTQQSSLSPLTSSELLKQFHWLPIEWRIRFKFASAVYKRLNTCHTLYLTELLQSHKPARSKRSSASHLLSVPRHNLSFGARAFRVSASRNGLQSFPGWSFSRMRQFLMINLQAHT